MIDTVCLTEGQRLSSVINRYFVNAEQRLDYRTSRGEKKEETTTVDRIQHLLLPVCVNDDDEEEEQRLNSSKMIDLFCRRTAIEVNFVVSHFRKLPVDDKFL